jgi:hypothetical protein
MRKMPRPPFPFDGAWLEGGGVVLHLIEDDPTIPRKQVAGSWKVCFLSWRILANTFPKVSWEGGYPVLAFDDSSIVLQCLAAVAVLLIQG